MVVPSSDDDEGKDVEEPEVSSSSSNRWAPLNVLEKSKRFFFRFAGHDSFWIDARSGWEIFEDDVQASQGRALCLLDFQRC